MRAVRQTRWLLAGVVVLGITDAAVHTAERAETAALPALPGFDPALVDRITLGRADAPVVLARAGEGWSLVAPASAPADPLLVDQLLEGIASGVQLEARVDEGDLERYGLDGGYERRVDVQQGERSLATLYVGNDAGGGASWVRLPGADTVYRARVGGRGRFDRSPGAWRDRQVTRLDPASISGVTIGSTVLTREGEGWRSAAGPLDAPTVASLVAGLAELRALEVAAPGRDANEPPLEVVLGLLHEDPVTLSFARVGQLWHVWRGEDRWRVGPELPELLVGAPRSLADRALWSVPVDEVARVELLSAERQGVLERDGAGWRVVRPVHVDVDPRRAAAAAEWLATPRVVAWSDAPGASHGFPSSHRWRITTGLQVRTIELGTPAGARVPVRDAAAPERIGWIDARIVAGIEAIFGG